MRAAHMLTGILIAIGVIGASFAQTDKRGGIPPGTSQDGSRPSDGAIQGGSIAPEKGGGPSTGSNALPKAKSTAATS